ncbi:hypothetical protein QK430_26245 [Pseudomonas aeruginosa]|uniref:hypothetical protein n=1 Tax=Pseudomonas TaxID=286 RepID=UPI00036E5C0A|nr:MULTISPECIES: hypothetical protein [Pseudomonas]MCZ7983360.1 hypothetical protein [Pseudomonas aeruginosa]MDI3943559.1 hypothetical protein [Pseudomonas aeruginosa]MDI3992908.1 hypothetical protein [Pseudomonas aeruginosa]MDP2551221.1 hypothetical protein [Pseudomonas aeruginosa]WMU36169.1 hypothetical protein P4B22_27645 [Pseudomonas aeruginosa]
MNAHTSKGFASRAGFGLGTFVRFCLHDHRPVVRWVKRVTLLVVLFVIFAENFTWLASAFMTLLSFGLIGLVLVKGDLSLLPQVTHANSSSFDDDGVESRAPFRGEYEHPDYHLYYKPDESQ